MGEKESLFGQHEQWMVTPNRAYPCSPIVIIHTVVAAHHRLFTCTPDTQLHLFLMPSISSFFFYIYP